MFGQHTSGGYKPFLSQYGLKGKVKRLKNLMGTIGLPITSTKKDFLPKQIIEPLLTMSKTDLRLYLIMKGKALLLICLIMR